jgi:nicotinate-nucleotide--dimethylbenzimidazole phosphoribosyltransferase
LPEERKALAERYTIDAEEAEARASRPAEELPRPEEAVAWAQRASEERARRQEAATKARRAAEEQARREEAVAWAQARRAAEEQARRYEAEPRAQLEHVAEEQAQHEVPTLALVPEPEPEEIALVPEPVPVPQPKIVPEPEPEPEQIDAVAHAVVEPATSEHDTTSPAAGDPQRDPEPEPNLVSDEPTEDLPVYAWVQRAVPEPPAATDWTRELVKAKEARGNDAHRA